jgi:hypothetical protein
MSESESEPEGQPETTSGLSTGAWIVIGVIGVVVVGGCMVGCLGMVGLGFILPARQAQQAAEAEAVRQQAQDTATQIQAEQEAAQKANQQDQADMAQPEADNSPANEKPDGKEDGDAKQAAPKDRSDN